MEAWGAGALGMTVEAGLTGLALVLAALLVRRRPSWKAGLLLLGLLQFLVPPLLTVPVPAPLLTVRIGTDPVAADTGTVMAALAWAQVAGLAAGVALLARSVVAYRRILGRARRVRDGAVHDALVRAAAGQQTDPPRLYLTDEAGPAAAGVFRPAVLLPGELARSLDTRALERVLAHEVAHLVRRDPLVAVIRRLAVSLWWFHPVTWLLARMQRAAAEDACDDAAAGGDHPGVYCDALLAAAAGGGRTIASAAGLGRHSLERRFRRLHRRRARPEPAAAPARWLMVAVAAAGLMAAPLGLPAVDTDGRADASQRIIIRHVVE